MVSMIPTRPKKQNLVKAAKTIKFPGPILDYLRRQLELRTRKGSNSWTRIDGNGLFPTIVTELTPADAKAGYSLH